ncbi:MULTISPECIES: glutamate 5-kinase [unclassified Pseudoclavibacter]|uniref:glutamate 5-kinase n=1 Tax=unclassified Pseudoclavibacter TaxID=2615177 RepID=UPI001300FB58|nr:MULTISPECIES: glutamate 5-kinase [unclassified Pseudoclavibacter]KAB1658555.1 glutamate 5-kinase [Pseudoclavibacter sp. CFCC 11306]KAB1661385.1 glutamate 5-kinase [Pseudoclavibacter sp. CFCC 13796]
MSTVISQAGIPGAGRIVVKVGSSSITGENEHQLGHLVSALAQLHEGGVEVVLVSSGAIATGLPLLNLNGRPADLATSQAAAAVGQARLMYRYESVFDAFSVTTAQVLLTASDIDDRRHRRQAQQTIDRLLDLRVLPIINENDTVATHEIRFGDNDRLAALTAVLVRADALVLLSDVDALYDRPPQREGSKPLHFVAHDDDLEHIEVSPVTVNGVGTGGAVTKIASARVATEAGIPVLLTSTEHVSNALSGQSIGTWFEARPVLGHELTDTGALQTIESVTHEH